MPAFQAKRFRPSTSSGSTLGDRLGAMYRANLAKHPFLLFGLPFISIMLAGSFLLTPATALRYERFDRRVQQVNQEEAMGLGLKGDVGDGEDGIKRNPRRRVLGSEREEYYKLMAKDLDNWEQKRVKRWKGEPDGRL
ncbi:Cytochrome oxidase assembly [Onygenales sp. PD_40]|nr:Cytochrome oxidase assembly [Onygenales sp. PD_40]KAK2781583.1 Cytochrome oxidase assembly [Onygenales sp. PD_12]KAK2787817.1 Cytochrome oxidase assembly [Emmonsiellopsis sp. PD_33]